MKVDFADKTVGGFNFEFVRGVSLQAAGAADGECMDTMSRVKNNNFDSWITRWAATADRVAAFAESEDRFGNTVSVRDEFLRASNYYRMAVFYASRTDARHTQPWRRSKDCFHRMITLMDTAVECVDIEFEKARLPAYFVSGGEGRRPTLIAPGGFDSTMEELYCWLGAAAPAYGWNCLMFEGPGQWSALKTNPGLTFRPDDEKPVGAVVDYLLTRSDVDPGRLAIIGYSMGGYLAARAIKSLPNGWLELRPNRHLRLAQSHPGRRSRASAGRAGGRRAVHQSIRQIRGKHRAKSKRSSFSAWPSSSKAWLAAPGGPLGNTTRNFDGSLEDHMPGGWGRPGRDDARLPARTLGCADPLGGKARRLFPRFPRGHGASVDHRAAGRARIS